MEATILTRRRFNEELLAMLSVPPSELEPLRELGRTEGAGFARLLVSRGVLTPEGLLRAYQALCGIPAFRNDPDADTPAPADSLPLSFLRAKLLVPVSAANGALTVAIAIHSALTGHMVLSTLHTNDAPGAVTRLLEMGVEEYLLPSVLVGVLAQRLVRTICEGCAAPREISRALREEVLRETGFVPEGNLRIGRGCDACGGTGFRGRSGIFELLPATASIKELILARPDAGALRTKAAAEGMRPLREDGWEKVRRGITTIEEVLRVTRAG